MMNLTIKLPDDKYRRLELLAQYRNTTMTLLMEEISTKALIEFDAYSHFLSRAARGKVERGLAILDELDSHFGTGRGQEAGGTIFDFDPDLSAYTANG